MGKKRGIAIFKFAHENATISARLQSQHGYNLSTAKSQDSTPAIQQHNGCSEFTTLPGTNSQELWDPTTTHSPPPPPPPPPPSKHFHHRLPCTGFYPLYGQQIPISPQDYRKPRLVGIVDVSTVEKAGVLLVTFV